ncbi:MAG: hypothetical protein K6G12_10115 [Lachnospiraceae bacterium]|nr:hypothetical protein [Lachnospiraceae bacterium]
METLLNLLPDEIQWKKFYDNREASGHLSKNELASLNSLILNKRYLPIARGILDGTYDFSIPRIARISKGGSSKKRIVYLFEDDEVWVLKFLSFLLHKYDGLFSDSCYSFRRDQNAKTAVVRILSVPDIDDKYVLKSDIHDYFNSVPVKRMCDRLKSAISDDPELTGFLCKLLSVDMAYDPENDILIRGERGVMAGTPIAPFLANLYLTGMDRYFENENILYLRYSDDILMFTDTEEEALKCNDILTDMIGKEGLTINGEKFKLISPGEEWEFLGFKYNRGTIDISDNTKRKIKSKIKRKAHSVYRWRIKKEVPFEKAAFVMIRSFNAKFYDIKEEGDFSWSKWFFPLINTTESLKEIDEYLISYIRFLYKGKHYKGNYRIKYKQLKELGFRSLVNEYWSR